MSETRIIIKDLEMNGETAIRIAECLKKHEPEIWKVLSGELKQATRTPDVGMKYKAYLKQAGEGCDYTIGK